MTYNFRHKHCQPNVLNLENSTLFSSETTLQSSHSRTSKNLSRSFRKGIRLSIKQRLRLKKRTTPVSHTDLPFTAASSKTLCAFIPLLILPYSFNTQALSATTANSIKGNAPELSAALQAEIVNGTFSLLNLVAKDSSGTATNYTSDTDPNFIAKINGITDLGKATLNDIAAVLANDTTGTLSGGFSALQAGDATDVDGDSNYSMTSTTMADWYYDNTSGTPVKITNTNQSICALAAAGQIPYIQIGASNLKLLTQYGDPRDNSYSNTTKKFNISPSTPFACFAKPNLTYGTGVYAGPTNEWNPSYGFIPQDINTPGSNFPTTGSNNLSFYLTIVGATAADIIVANTGLLQGNITVTLAADDQIPASLNVLKVTLTGPKNGSTGNAAKVTLPAEFKLKVPVSGGGTRDIYNFAISKWFIAKPGDGGGYPAVQTYCSLMTGYTIPSQADYTNQFHGVFIPGTTVFGNYTRAISGALYSEWGYTANNQTIYGTSDWETFFSWASEPYNAGLQYTVRSSDGIVAGSDPANDGNMAACVSY